VQFLTAPNSTAAQSFRFFVRDDGGTANGGSNTSFTAAVNIQVTASNDAPEISAPASLPIFPATTTPLTGLAVTDIDSGAAAIDLQMVVSHGTLTVNTGIVGGVNAGQVITSGGRVLIVTAPVGALAVTLAGGGISYRADTGFVGQDTLSISVFAGGATGTGPEGIATRDVSLLVGQTSGWQNPRNRLDVTDDGQVAPGDALAVINYINANPNDSDLPAAPQVPPPYYDVNGDRLITSADVLAVVNYLNVDGLAEGEAPAGSSAAALIAPLPVTASVGAADAAAPASQPASTPVASSPAPTSDSPDSIRDQLLSDESWSARQWVLEPDFWDELLPGA